MSSSPSKRSSRSLATTEYENVAEKSNEASPRGRRRGLTGESSQKGDSDITSSEAPAPEVRRSRRSQYVDGHDKEGHYPCSVAGCNYVDDTRAGRLVHIRNEHPGDLSQHVKREPEEAEDEVQNSVPFSPPPPSSSRTPRHRKVTETTDLDMTPVVHEETVEATVVEGVSPKKGRGRPRKSDVHAESVKTPRRQTASKNTVPEEDGMPKLKPADAEDSPQRRGRGRPRKSTADQLANIVKVEEFSQENVVVDSVVNDMENELHNETDELELGLREGEELYEEIIEEVIEEEEAPRTQRRRSSRKGKNRFVLDPDDGSIHAAPSYPNVVTVVSEDGEEEEYEDLDIEDFEDDEDFVEIDVEVDQDSDGEYKAVGRMGDAARRRADAIEEMRKQQHRAIRGHPDGDPKGRYPCYVDGCKWRGNFRSVRCTHMRNVHPDWVRPPRFVLNRIAADGTLLQANDVHARYTCFIEGCPWTGNYRASRSNHMRTQHKDWVPKRTRAANGGYVATGKYHCHVEECAWRGISRSTRAQHMKRVHPGFVNPVYTPRSIPCNDCGVSLSSHKLFVDHMVVEHKIGGIVQREFTDVRDYEDWFEAVQESFSIDFVKKMGVKSGPNYQILYLYCARSGGFCTARGLDKKLDPLGLYEPKHTRMRHKSTNKCGKNCAAFLRVMHWNDGRLSIIGCVEHTGHRLGTALLRLSATEREAMDEYLYMMDDATPLDFIVDRLREIEGFTADGYLPVEHSPDFLSSFMNHEDEKESLRLLVEGHELFGPSNTFCVTLPPVGSHNAFFQLGIMNERMRELWTQYAHKAVHIEEVRLVLSHWEIHVFLVFVLDADQSPRIACIYIANDGDREPIFRKLSSVWAGSITTFVTDCSPEYPDLIERYFGHANNNIDMQIAEWHLLAEWAAHIDAMILNRVDKYGVICVLRRLLRTTEVAVFEATVHELFDGLREMQQDEVAQFIDNQLDPSFAKRWSPMVRNPLTEHNNPTLEFACRMLRERFLSCEHSSRIDEYVGLLVQRVEEFNKSVLSPVYATREPDPPRELPQVYVQHTMEHGEDEDDEPMMGGGEEQENWQMANHHQQHQHGQQHHQQLQYHHHQHPVGNETNSESILDKCTSIIDMDIPSGSSHILTSPLVKRRKVEETDDMMEEVVEEEIIEEEVVDFDEAQIINQLCQQEGLHLDEMTAGDDEMGRDPKMTDKKQKLMAMMAMLQEKLENIADDECIELVESNLEQVVSTLQRVPKSPK